MYNGDRKTEYLDNKQYNYRKANEHIVSARNTLIGEFNNVAWYEEILQKDLSEFSKAEILKYYGSIKTNSLERLMLINSHFGNYTEWIGSKNNYKKITQPELREQIVDYEDEFITRESLLKMIKKIKNVSNKFLLLGLFEGVCGKQMTEISCVCSDCVKIKDSILINRGEWLDGKPAKYKNVSHELYKLALSSIDEYFYLSSDNSYLNYDKQDPRALKQMENANQITDKKLVEVSPTRYHMIMNRLDNCRKALNNPYITRTGLTNCGRIQLIKDLYSDGNYRDIRECIVDNKDVIEERYGKFSSIQRFILKWGKYI